MGLSASRDGFCHARPPSVHAPLITLITVALLACSALAAIPSHYNVSEEQPEGTFVADVKKDFPFDYPEEILSELRFTFRQRGPSYDLFQIDAESGHISTRVVIDRETLSSCVFLEVCDLELSISVKPLQYFQIIKVKIRVLDINDHAPSFPERLVTWSIPENKRIGSRFPVVSAEDQDHGVFGVQIYNMTSSSNKFRLDSVAHADDSFEVSVILVGSLDREDRDYYPLRIQAWDGGQPPKSGVVLVDVRIADSNDNNPIFQNHSYKTQLYEHSAVGTVLIHLQATDDDTGLNGQVTYRLEQSTSQQLGHLFAVHNRTGEVYVKGDVDYEKGSHYELQVMAADMGPNSLPAFCKVVVEVLDINDNAPVISVNTLEDNQDPFVQENADVDTFVAHISVSDRDQNEGGEFTCELDTDLFKLDTLADTEFMLSTDSVFDRELHDRYHVTLTCTDHGDPPKQNRTHIGVNILDMNDHSPVFSRHVYNFSIGENRRRDVKIERVNATDQDEGVNSDIRYSLQILDPQEDVVYLDPVTGVLRSSVVFDYEKRTNYSFLVTAVDQGIPPLSVTAVVNLAIKDQNDEVPVFRNDLGNPTTRYTFSILENQVEGSSVGTVKATDDDSKPYSKILYSIDNFLSGTDAFTIDSKQGLILTTGALDREEIPEYHLVVFATNDGFPEMSTRVDITVMIEDENDEPPELLFPSKGNSTVIISSDVPVGHVVARIRAVDPDEGNDSHLLYSIANGNDDHFFKIDNRTGALTIAGDLNEQTQEMRHLVVRVTEDNNPDHHTITDLKIYIVAPEASSHSFLDGSNFMILIGAACGILFILVIIVVACVFLRLRNRQSKKENRYNCQMEESKRLSAGPGTDFDLVSSAERKGNRHMSSDIHVDKEKTKTIKKEVTFTCDLDEKISPMVPLCPQNPDVVQNPRVLDYDDSPNGRRVPGAHRRGRGEGSMHLDPRGASGSHDSPSHQQLLPPVPPPPPPPPPHPHLQPPHHHRHHHHHHQPGPHNVDDFAFDDDHDSESGCSGSYTDSGRGGSEEGDHYPGMESRYANMSGDPGTYVGLSQRKKNPLSPGCTLPAGSEHAATRHGQAKKTPKSARDYDMSRSFPLLDQHQDPKVWPSYHNRHYPRRLYENNDQSTFGRCPQADGALPTVTRVTVSPRYRAPGITVSPRYRAPGIKKAVRFQPSVDHRYILEEECPSTDAVSVTSEATSTSGSFVLDPLESAIHCNSSVV